MSETDTAIDELISKFLGEHGVTDGEGSRSWWDRNAVHPNVGGLVNRSMAWNDERPGLQLIRL